MSDGINNNNDEIIIDFRKIWITLCYRKKLIFLCFAVILIATVGMTLMTPKKYKSEARILINKSNSTNLANINPFLLSDMTDAEGVGFANVLGGGASLGNELEIIKSPLVIDKVIKNNGLKYKKGPKAGEYLSTDDFLRKDIAIESIKGTNAISIEYKSTNPEQTYNIINSIINSYKEIYENINSKKAIADKQMLLNAYNEAKSELDTILNNLKNLKNLSNESNAPSTMNYSLLSMYVKQINRDMNRITSDNIDAQKLEHEVSIKTEEVKMLNSKIEWLNLVENVSKEASKITVLKEPVLKRKFEASEPNVLSNLILGFFVSCFVSLFAVIISEIIDKKLTFSAIGEKNYIYDKDNLNSSELKTELYLNKTAKVGVISLISNSLYNEINNRNLFKQSNIFTLFETDSIEKDIENIKNADKLIFIAQVGSTNKKTYKKYKDIYKKLNKEVLLEFIIK